MKHSTSENGAWTTRRSLALLGTIAIWLIAAIDLWFIWPSTLGGATSFVVVSGKSMEPTYFSGDLVIARKMEASVGDVIVYAPQSLGGAQIVHRIIGGNAEDGWVMQGDNNNFIDPFEPTGDEVKGVVVVHYSDIGRVTALMLNPIFWAALILAGVVLLVWFSGDDCDDDEEDGEDGEEAALTDAGEAELEDELAPSKLSRAGPALRTTAFIAAAVWAFSAGFSPAAAATLTVAAGDEAKPYTLNACGDPTPAWGSTTTATGTTSSQVTVSNIPSGCVNRAATVTLYDSSGSVLATLTGTPTTSTFAFTTFATGPSSYTVAQVSTAIVKIGGWVFPTAWTAPNPSIPAYACVAVNPGGNVPGGGTCTVSNVQVTTWTSGGYQYANVSMTITSSHTNARVTLDLSKTPFPGWTPQSLMGNGDFVVATVPAPAYQCSQLPVLEMNRNTSNGSWTLYFQMTTQPNAFPWATGTSRICP
jgi:signal peptidase I